MSKARRRENQKEEIWADHYKKSVHTSMVCHDCRCPVLGVSRGTRNVGDNQISIDPFFRLFGGAEKNGTGHTADGDYNIEKIIAVLVAESRAVESLDDAAEALLSSRSGKKKTLRLHILMEVLRVKEATGRFPGSDADVVIRERIGARYVRSGMVLDSYLKSANGVLNFIMNLQEKRELANWIVIKYGPHEIPWGDYFFDLFESDYARLRSVLVKNNQIAGTRTEKLRPITLAIQVLKGSRPRKTDFGEWSLLMRAQPFKDVSEECERFSLQPVLYFKDEQLANDVTQERYILACGLPRISQKEPSPRPSLSPFSKVTMKIVSPTQLCRYKPMRLDL